MYMYSTYILTFLSRVGLKSLAVDQLERPADLYKDQHGSKEDEIVVTLVFRKQMVSILFYVGTLQNAEIFQNKNKDYIYLLNW